MQFILITVITQFIFAHKFNCYFTILIWKQLLNQINLKQLIYSMISELLFRKIIVRRFTYNTNIVLKLFQDNYRTNILRKEQHFKPNLF